MDSATQFATEIGSLIEEIEAIMTQHPSPAQPSGKCQPDREFRLQREAFHERARQARSLAERLSRSGDDTLQGIDGDTHRVREALRLSREYFGRLA